MEFSILKMENYINRLNPENLFFSSHVEVVLKVCSLARSFFFSKLHNVRKGQEVKEKRDQFFLEIQRKMNNI